MHRYRDNFRLKMPCINGGCCPLLRKQCVAIHVLTGDVIGIRHIFCGNTHGGTYTQIRQRIPHGVSQLHMAELLPIAGVEYHVWCGAHAVSAPSKNTLCFTGLDLVVAHLH